MKGLGKTLISIGMISVLFLWYVQGHISLLKISYTIDTYSKQLDQRLEEYRYLRFEVDQLKAPRRLEEKMKELKLDLTLPKEIRVVRVPVAPDMDMPEDKQVELQPLSKGLSEFLGRWVKVAQAKTDA